VPSEGDVTPPARGRKRALAAVTLVVVAAVVVVAIVATRGGGHKPARSPRTAAGAATVQRRNLVTSENETGTISYANSSTVANRLQGTLTWAPAVGRVIDPGERLFDVDNFPVLLMNGTTPAYRTLDSSDSAGPDVQQLNADLIDLGFNADGIVVDDEWQPATTAGVEEFQESNGEPETGSLTLGTIVFLRGAQRVAGLEGGATTISDDPAEGHAEFVGYMHTTTTTGTSTLPTTATTATTATTSATSTTSTTPAQTAPEQNGGALKRADAAISKLGTVLQQLQRQNQRLERQITAASSHRPSKRPSDSGDSGPASGGNGPVMTTTSTNLVVTVDVSAGEQGVTRVGARVPVVMPSGATVDGRVVKIGQATSAGGGGGSTVPITIHLDKHENGRDLDQATVSVTFIEKTARHVLSVPVTALLAQPGGRYAVQEATAPGKLIDVRLGTFATGYVRVSGRGLYPGLKITDSQG
jgi:peptidoglycan hydrolase-like protein with peptidoglycan-binding domain